VPESAHILPNQGRGRAQGAAMLQIKKLTIGIRPNKKMFRMRTEGPRIVDALIAEQPGRKPDEQQFDQVTVNAASDRYVVRTPDERDFVSMDISHIAYSRHIYDGQGTLHVDRFVEEFAQVWSVITRQTKVNGIRMLGMVAEHRVSEVQNPTSVLLSKLTNLDGGTFPTKFVTTFERRTPFKTGGSGIPDFKNIEFANVIISIYDAIRDDAVATENAINANLDAQLYFAPLRDLNINDELRRLRRTFEDEWREFGVMLKQRGLVAQ